MTRHASNARVFRRTLFVVSLALAVAPLAQGRAIRASFGPASGPEPDSTQTPTLEPAGPIGPALDAVVETLLTDARTRPLLDVLPDARVNGSDERRMEDAGRADRTDQTPRNALLVSVIDESQAPSVVIDRLIGNDQTYFYPASTVKLLAAVGALLRIQELRAEGIAVHAETPMTFHPLFDGEPTEDADPSNQSGGTITVAHEIRKLFIVSDNRAFNRLLGFVGRADLNRMMHDAGLASVRINHRLSTGYSREQNRRMPRIDLRIRGETRGDAAEPIGTMDASAGNTNLEADVYTIPARLDPPIRATAPAPSQSPPDPDESTSGVRGLRVGSAHIAGGVRVNEPKDFRFSNRVSLEDLRDALIMIVRPDVNLGKPGFGLTDAHRQLLIEAMGTLPRESMNPVYDAETYPDDWVKFLLPGVRRVIGGDRARILNKIGLAYGFTTTTACITIDDAAPAVFVTGTIYTNDNATLNDNVYEYDTVAMPFWSSVGEIVTRGLIADSQRRDTP